MARATRATSSSALARAALVGAIVMAAGCYDDPTQSVLHPASPAASAIEWLWWVLFWVCTVVFVIVLVLLTIGLLWRRRSGKPAPPLGNRFIFISGVVLPAIVLIGLLVVNLRAAIALREGDRASEASSGTPPLTIRVIGHQWWWEVHYPDYGITIANEIQIPVGQPVRVELRSADVIHSFWVPQLGGKMDMIPGIELTNYTLRADAPGNYRGQCAEFCGIQHALMALYVVALPPTDFEAWVAARRTPPAEPVEEVLVRGRAAFARGACGNCHAIRGTEFTGKIGPDLTHMGSRMTIGAGTLPNTPGNLAGWIANPQPLKPGNLMPPSHLAPQDLLALTDYLLSLK